ncbi:MAG: hypothetical protein ACJ71W_21960 [Terriglobales bacterium]
MTDEREVVRCDNPRCRLNQFRTVSGNCRKCREPLPVVVEGEPQDTGVKIEVLQPAEIVALALSDSREQQPTQPRAAAVHIQPRNREPKTKKPRKKKLALAIEIPPRQKAANRSTTARGCYDEVRRARTAKER